MSSGGQKCHSVRYQRMERSLISLTLLMSLVTWSVIALLTRLCCCWDPSLCFRGPAPCALETHLTVLFVSYSVPVSYRPVSSHKAGKCSLSLTSLHGLLFLILNSRNLSIWDLGAGKGVLQWSHSTMKRGCISSTQIWERQYIPLWNNRDVVKAWLHIRLSNPTQSFSAHIIYSFNLLSGVSSPILSWLIIYVAYPSQHPSFWVSQHSVLWITEIIHVAGWAV